ncbi:DUF2642 domain-containing protein [Cohnella terricola]|uniref:DUF2642 domain-containing protein n=1 Tax=Cohnella terricola TaxID=1289167 RepID=A0A559JW44_9BACL|nr:DUF2642 domain-containing protein [Cohnella terricola]TVY04098.1 DUF2642 domain-containing protein [Cohnella terricola]
MDNYLNQAVSITVSGIPLPITGRLVDLGPDVLVIFDGTLFLYIPLVQVELLTSCPPHHAIIAAPSQPPLDAAKNLSYRKVLWNSKGVFSVIHIAGNQTVHGYVTSIMNDFFVFHSSTFRSLYVSMRHLKILSPYDSRKIPYAIKQNLHPIHSAAPPLARMFDQQLKKFENEFVVLDLGKRPEKVGLLTSVQNNLLELVTADSVHTFTHLDHVQTIHRP